MIVLGPARSSKFLSLKSAVAGVGPLEGLLCAAPTAPRQKFFLIGWFEGLSGLGGLGIDGRSGF